MKTRKTLRTTGWIQLACCLILLLDLGFSAYAANQAIPVSGDSLWFELWDSFGGLGTILWFTPVAIVCLAVNLACLVRTAIPAVTAIGSVKPHLEDIAILG